MISLNSCLCARQGGRDRPFLGELFAQLAAGRFGNLAPDRVAARGWSGGAHMVSWLLQAQAGSPGRHCHFGRR